MSNEPIKYCCEVFPKIMSRFKWYSFDDDNGVKIMVMPCIAGTDYRVNNCPSCGKEVRSIHIPEKQFIQDECHD